MSEAVYRIQVAAQLSGVSEPLIRAWERRYGVLNPKRTPGGYRTYSDADIEVLKRLKQLTEEGVAIAQAVQQLPSIKRAVRAGVRTPPRAPQPEELEAWHQAVLKAAARLDQPAIQAVLEEASGKLSAEVFFDALLAPLLREVGDRWHAGTLTVAQEHLVSQAVRGRLNVLLASAPHRDERHVVCASPPDEDHELGLLGAALHFRHAGWQVTFLGARTPVEHLAQVVEALKPDLVAISVVNSHRVRPYLEALGAALPRGTRTVLGGAGITPHRELAARLGFKVLQQFADVIPWMQESS
ncbi:MAG: MerR family transcriptional regulator [Myxococcota bacterium]|nr:MerR family transcriptional regulator [Myxococcota bacterium]